MTNERDRDRRGRRVILWAAWIGSAVLLAGCVGLYLAVTFVIVQFGYQDLNRWVASRSAAQQPVKQSEMDERLGLFFQRPLRFDEMPKAFLPWNQEDLEGKIRIVEYSRYGRFIYVLYNEHSEVFTLINPD